MGDTFNPDGSVSIDMDTIKNIAAMDGFSLAGVGDISKALNLINDPEIWKCHKRINAAAKELGVELQNLRNRLDDTEVTA